MTGETHNLVNTSFLGFIGRGVGGNITCDGYREILTLHWRIIESNSCAGCDRLVVDFGGKYERDAVAHGSTLARGRRLSVAVLRQRR